MLTVIREAASKVGGVPKLARKLGVSRQAILSQEKVTLFADIAAIVSPDGAISVQIRKVSA